MIRVFAVLLVVVCVVLTVALLASLRGIAELRLRLAGNAGLMRGDQVVIGRRLPARLVAAVQEPERESVVAFLSTGCGSCLALCERLRNEPEQLLTACVVGDDPEEVLAALPPWAVTVGGADADRVVAEMPTGGYPVAMLQRDGHVVAVVRGVDAADLDLLRAQGAERQAIA